MLQITDFSKACIGNFIDMVHRKKEKWVCDWVNMLSRFCFQICCHTAFRF